MQHDSIEFLHVSIINLLCLYVAINDRQILNTAKRNTVIEMVPYITPGHL